MHRYGGWLAVVANLAVRRFPRSYRTRDLRLVMATNTDVISLHPVAGADEAGYGTSTDQEAADQPD